MWITGFGVVSSLGRGRARLWSAMAEGEDGLAPLRRFDAAALGVAIAGMIPDRNVPGDDAGPSACAALAEDAAREAWAHAALDDGRVARDRVALVFGSSLGDSEVAIQEIAAKVGDALGVGGPRIAVTTACASSANAIGLALDVLRMGAADAVIAGGADVLTPLVLAGFRALGVLAPGKCAPFSEPPGTTLAEGAGFLVLERAPTPNARAAVCGYGLSTDAYHETGPDPSGAGVARALGSAIAHAGIERGAIDYINAHGTGTRANDPAEWRAIQQVLGERAERTPVSSSKSFLGHAQGAAGVLETIATLLAMEHGAIPPTQRYTTARPHTPRDPVAQATPRPAHCDTAISSSSGFGGANCAIVVARVATSPAGARRRIAIVGSGGVGPKLEGDVRRGRVPAFALEALAPAIDPRGLDPTTRYLAAATALALADAGTPQIAMTERDRSGLVVGLAVASRESDAALHATIARAPHHDFRGLSASMFARQVVNAGPGTCARLFQLRGAHSVVSAARATGLVAIIYAAELLATRHDLARIVAAGCDELAATADLAADASEGAVAHVLAPLAADAADAIELAGWALAGPGRVAEAAARALAAADLARPHATLAAADIARMFGAADGYAPAAAVHHAVTMIEREDAATSVLVTCEGSSAAALVLRRGGLRR